MKYLESFRHKVFGADPDEVAAYHSVLPRSIEVTISKDGKYLVGKVKRVDGNKTDNLLITQGRNFEDLVDSVNDLMYTYVNMPTHIRPYYGNMFRPPSSSKSNKTVKELTLVKV